MLIDSPPSHRASRVLVVALLVAAFIAATAGLVLTGTGARLVDGAKEHIVEVRDAWKS